MNDCHVSKSKLSSSNFPFASAQVGAARTARLLLAAALLTAGAAWCSSLTAQEAGRISAAPQLTSSQAYAALVIDAPSPSTTLVNSTGPNASVANATPADSLLPDAPLSASDSDDAQASQTQQQAQARQVQAARSPQTKRILGIIPNFRSITTDEKVPPQTVKDKFVTASEDSFDYSSIVIPALLAGYSLGVNSTPEFGHGGIGYARYLWHSAVDQTSENYMVEFIVPSLTHEDTRYYTLAYGSFWKRTAYSVSRAVITRTDSGKETFNLSEVVGSGASAGLSTLYYPSRERSFGNTGKQWGLDVGIDGASFFVKEFWPDINHWLFHGAKPNAAPPATQP